MKAVQLDQASMWNLMSFSFHSGFARKEKWKKVVECSTPKVLSALERNDSGAEEIYLSETCAGRCILEQSI